jgi:hypothetical protein
VDSVSPHIKKNKRTNPIEHIAAVPLQYPELKHTPHLFYVPRENNQGDSGLLNDLAREFVSGSLLTAQCSTYPAVEGNTFEWL